MEIVTTYFGRMNWFFNILGIRFNSNTRLIRYISLFLFVFNILIATYITIVVAFKFIKDPSNLFNLNGFFFNFEFVWCLILIYSKKSSIIDVYDKVLILCDNNTKRRMKKQSKIFFYVVL